MKITNFIVKSSMDQDITNERKLRNIDEFILAGAALGDYIESKDIFIDDTGGGYISLKNRKYCELTALFWIWKNCDDDYIGLEHYRRAFELSESSVMELLNQNVDLIIPEKLEFDCSVEEQFKSVVCNDVWDTMMKVIEDIYPFVKTSAQAVFYDKYIYPFNMMICKKAFLDSYCKWLFPILFRVEELVGSKWDVYQERYPGFLAERLFTLFVRIHAQDFVVCEAPVKLFCSLKSNEINVFSEKEIIEHIWNCIEKRRGMAAWNYLSLEVPATIIYESEKLTHLYKLLQKNLEDNLYRGDTYLLRNCTNMEQLLSIKI